MEYHEQTDAFMFDLMNLIGRYRKEFDLSPQTLVGVMEFVKNDLMTADDVFFSEEPPPGEGGPPEEEDPQEDPQGFE